MIRTRVDFDTLGHELSSCGGLLDGFNTFMIICSQNSMLCEISISDYVEELINYGFAQVSPKTHTAGTCKSLSEALIFASTNP